MTDDLLQGGNAWKWSYRYGDPRDRFALTLGLRDPYADMRDPWWLPQAGRCWISPEINQERAQEAARDRKLWDAMDQSEARLAARILYRAQRRQALVAITGGLLIMILVLLIAL